jgi:tRNA uridine 5-carboxymethylaminomethyl modification enzyme
MFTSRAEYRLTLRADNADQRLTGKGIAIGCVGSERQQQFEQKMFALNDARTRTNSLSITPNEAAGFGVQLKHDGQRRTAFDLLSYPNLEMADVARIWPQLADVAPKIAEQLEIDAKYSVYLDRQTADIESYRKDESFDLPDDLDYAALPGLSHELRQKLAANKPRTIGQAGRIDGITPAALTLLVAYVRRSNKGRRPAA